MRGRARSLLGLLLCDFMGGRGRPVGLRQRADRGAPGAGQAVEGAPAAGGLRAGERCCLPAFGAPLLRQRGRALLLLCRRIGLCWPLQCTRTTLPALTSGCQTILHLPRLVPSQTRQGTGALALSALT